MDSFNTPAGFLDACKHPYMTSVVSLQKGSQDIIAGFSVSVFSAATWSHCKQSNTTYALVLDEELETFQDIFKIVGTSEKQRFHPLFIPTAIFCRDLDFLRALHKKAEEEGGKKAEFISAFKGTEADGAVSGNFEENVKKLQGVITRFVVVEAGGQVLSRGLAHLLKASERIKDLDSDLESWIRYMDRASQELTKAALTYIKWIELGLSTYNSIIAYQNSQHNANIANASKRDSSSMKSLAILSVIFVPPSCISAIMSMPMFSFERGDFWIFWAYTVPITGVTLIIWSLYMFLIDRHHEKERIVVGPRGGGEEPDVKSTVRKILAPLLDFFSKSKPTSSLPK
ncbi:hypothetical protein HDK90DRAFT_472159 [Phyllosticta capitalensis]|uniref:Uncharacterized protein n=1 Tax=Phyllosticta capitalensis TaxID=121624 RepID=A0ABR1Z3C4_9PEZI